MTRAVVRRGQGPGRRAAARAAVESLEQRFLLATFNVTGTDDDGPGSLRWAIEHANLAGNAGEVDRIEFNIAGDGLHVISPTSALPEITEAVVIDGRTQPGYAGAPLVEINGSLAGEGADGLLITAGNSQVLGLAIHAFSGNGVVLFGGSGNVVQGCYIGTDPAGTAGEGNGLAGVSIFDSSDNVIGGAAAGQGNVISANAVGVEILGAAAGGNTVSGNFIGTDADAAEDLGNLFAGVLIDGSPDNTVSDNVIALSQFGVVVTDAVGEIVDPANGNLIRRNSIFGHVVMGIDLGADGTTGNDADDLDVGPNGLQNFPVITRAELIADDQDGDPETDAVRITGTFSGKADAEVTLDFFLADPVQEPGQPQSRRYLGSRTLTTNEFGQAAFDVRFDGLVAPGGMLATMTATTADGTSELSAGMVVTGGQQEPAITITPNAISGQQHRRLTVLVAVFADGLPGTLAGDYTVLIDWGDGVLSSGVVEPQAGEFFITAFHRYAAEGEFDVAIQISHGDGRQQSAQTTALITANELSGSGEAFDATAGREIRGQAVATFTSLLPGLLPEDFLARINWGDGSSSNGRVVLRQDGAFEVLGSHIYGEGTEGEKTVTVTIGHAEDDLGIVLSGLASIQLPPTVTAAGINVAAVAGTRTGLVRVATFVTDRAAALTSDFWATIDWGDGTRSRGLVTASPKGGGRFAVSAQHAYRKAGAYDVKVIVRDLADDGARARATCRAKVVPAPWTLMPLSGSLSARAGQQFAPTVMRFKTANLLARAGEFSAKINWGDGAASRGEVKWRGDGTFDVRGVHTYSQRGVMTVKVLVADRSGNELVHRMAVAVV